MEKEFVPYQESFEMKELGFNEPCLAKYTVIPEDEINWFTIPEQGITDKGSFGSSKNYNTKSFEEEGSISAPTYSQAFRWFREKYELSFECKTPDGAQGKWVPEIHKVKGFGNHFDNEGFDTYEEAELACLRKLIELVKNK